MATRNFWVECNIDGRATKLEGGPRSKDGGFNLTIYQRDEGAIKEAITITGYKRTCDDVLMLRVVSSDGVIMEVETKR